MKENFKANAQDVLNYYQNELTKKTMDVAVLSAQLTAKDKEIKALTQQITSQAGSKEDKK